MKTRKTIQNFCLVFFVLFSQEAHVSGMSAGSIGTKWYNLTILGGISIMPAPGSEQAIYSGLKKEGEHFENILEPLRDELEKIVLEAKERFNAPITIYNPKQFP